MADILGAVQDGEIKTQEQARALIAEEGVDYAKVLNISEEAARGYLLANITNAVRLYYPLDEQPRIADLFELTLEENDGKERTNPVSEM
jgi:hypothetical protein